MVFDSMEQKALAYAASRHAELGDSLGFGVDGSVWLLHGKDRNHPWAVKLFRSSKPYERERDCYLRLHELQVETVRGFAVPAYLHHDDEHLAVEMTIVRPPYLLDFAGALLDEPFDFHEETPTAMEVSDATLNLFVGFSAGHVSVYKVEKFSQLIQLSRFECHKKPVRILHNVDSSGFLLSTGDDKSLMVNDLGGQPGFYQEEALLLHQITATYFNTRLGVLILGDSAGRMHIYQTSNQFRGRKFNLVLTEQLHQDTIVSILADSKEMYIFVAYQNGLVEIYETGKGFQSIPVLIKNFRFGSQVKKMRLATKNKTLLLSHDRGVLSFLDFTDPNHCYSHWAHSEALADFCLAEDERIITTGGADGVLSMWYYDDKLFAKKMPEGRGIERWRNIDVEDFFTPTRFYDDNLMRQKQEKMKSGVIQPVEAPKKDLPPPTRSRSPDEGGEDDDLVGWDS